VLRDVGLKFEGQAKLPRVNQSAVRKVNVSSNDLKLIREFYAEDYSAFGYETEGTED
jgi:hypothetical protein